MGFLRRKKNTPKKQLSKENDPLYDKNINYIYKANIAWLEKYLFSNNPHPDIYS